MILIFHPVVIDTYLYSMRQDKNRDITCFELTPLFWGVFLILKFHLQHIYLNLNKVAMHESVMTPTY